jgi:hypothetical protein
MVWVPQLKPKQNITVMIILHWFTQHLVGQMLGAKSNANGSETKKWYLFVVCI